MHASALDAQSQPLPATIGTGCVRTIKLPGLTHTTSHQTSPNCMGYFTQRSQEQKSTHTPELIKCDTPCVWCATRCGQTRAWQAHQSSNSP
jgi:hypothetical protein